VRGMRRSRRCRTCRGRRGRWIVGDGDDAAHLSGEVADHRPGDRLMNEANELGVVEGCWDKGKRVSPRHEERERVELTK